MKTVDCRYRFNIMTRVLSMLSRNLFCSVQFTIFGINFDSDFIVDAMNVCVKM